MKLMSGMLSSALRHDDNGLVFYELGCVDSPRAPLILPLPRAKINLAAVNSMVIQPLL